MTESVRMKHMHTCKVVLIQLVSTSSSLLLNVILFKFGGSRYHHLIMPFGLESCKSLLLLHDDISSAGNARPF